MASASGHVVLRFFSLAEWKNSDQKKSLISKNHLNISAALPQLCSDFSPPVVNWGLGSRRQEQSQDGMRKPQPHLAKQQCSQPGMGEKQSNRKVREGDTWHDTGVGGVWIQKRNQERGGTTGKGTAAPGPEQQSSKTKAGPGQKGQCCCAR